MQAIRAALLAAISLSLASLDLAFAAPVRGLFVDGKETQTQSAAYKTILEAGGTVLLDMLTAPAKGEPFEPAFDKYKVVVLNYSGDTWPLATVVALGKYVENGGGLVVLVQSDAAFPMWTDYGAMLGVNGASNRDENAGPIWFYHDNNLAYDKTTKGPPGKAPKPDQPFLVTFRNTEHPIAKGLPLQWMHATDTLLGSLRGPGRNMIALATAHSDEEHGGTGRDEPVMLIVSYGKGRVFHMLLGSAADGMSCVGFQTALQRGAEWAGSGKVTARIPTDFPREDKPSVRPVK